MWTRVSPKKRVRWGAYCRHLANTTEPSICGGDAAFLSNYFDHLLLLRVSIAYLWLTVLATKVSGNGRKERSVLSVLLHSKEEQTVAYSVDNAITCKQANYGCK